MAIVPTSDHFLLAVDAAFVICGRRAPHPCAFHPAEASVNALIRLEKQVQKRYNLWIKRDAGSHGKNVPKRSTRPTRLIRPVMLGSSP